MEKPIKRARETDSDWVNFLNMKHTEFQSIETKLNNLKSIYSSSSWNFEQITDFNTQASDLYIKFRNLSLPEDFARELNILSAKSVHVNWLYLKLIQNYNLISQSILDFIEIIKFDSKFIYNIFSYSNRVVLLAYDTETCNKRKRLIETPLNLDEGTCLIPLPNASLFCIGSWSQQWTSCIIDLKSFSIKKTKIPLTIKRSNSGGIYFDNNIYIFGGMYKGYSSIPYAEKFDLKRQIWRRIPYLPQSSYCCYCVIFKGSILISGHEQQTIYKFDVNIESYSEISNFFFKKKIKKILFMGNSRVYLSVDNKIFESEYLNEYKWNTVLDFSFPNQLSYSYIFIKQWEDSVYFGMSSSSGEYLKFDLTNKLFLQL